jgi:DNA-binding NtrC family response regulator
MKKILIVDDELLIRDLLYDCFSSHDYQIRMAESGEKALDILDKENIDCIVTDLKMPDMDGLELVEKANEATERSIPVIIMTGFPSLESAIEAIRKRVYDYFVKPFNTNRVLDAVKRAVADLNGIEQVGSSDG